MSSIAIDYEIEHGPPYMAKEDYVSICNDGYRALLEKDPEEHEVQDFLERHPSLVPGHSTPGARSGHPPLHCSLIAQPKLYGLDRYIPDFMWISTHSGSWYPTLIEIEKPGKKIFNKDGTPSSNFTRARNQLNQWRSWFNSPSNQQQFLEQYGIPDYMRMRTMQLHMILIYGRRSEFANDHRLTQQRGTLLPGTDEELMSFDGLQADGDITQALTVKAVGHGRYHAITVPPVFTTGPHLASRLVSIDGMGEAIDKTPNIPPDRKAFLKRRIPYWRNWASAPGTKVIGPNSVE
jgi:hypothetical protein